MPMLRRVTILLIALIGLLSSGATAYAPAGTAVVATIEAGQASGAEDDCCPTNCACECPCSCTVSMRLLPATPQQVEQLCSVTRMLLVAQRIPLTVNPDLTLKPPRA